MQPTFLGVIRYGENILNVPLDNQINAGIGLRNVFGGATVSVFEENMVRQDIGYTLESWSKLLPQEKAIEIAVARIKNSVKNHQTEAEIESSKSKSRKK